MTGAGGATDERIMRRCLQLASNGAMRAAPNPMVGAVLARDGTIMAEGWHMQCGGPHAEVNCLRTFGDGAIPTDATLYVNLEPCAHHGATPPCVDLLIARGVRRLVVGCVDPDPRTHGSGIARARQAGIEVVTEVLNSECRWLNRRFITSMEHQRPFIVLKWAQSTDGAIDNGSAGGRGVHRISSPTTDQLVHRWRAEEQAILVGSRTVVNDDPALNVRHGGGRSPLRVILDRKGATPDTSKVYTDGGPVLLFTSELRRDIGCEQIIIAGNADPIDAVLRSLHERSVRSVLVEGGAELHQHFIDRELWDEARVITSPRTIGAGTRAARITQGPQRASTSATDIIAWYVADRSGSAVH